ncbi:allantoinase, mitochondrial isoform X2 [Anabrus simplex]
MPVCQAEVVFRSKQVLLDDCLQEAAIVVGKDGCISKVLRAHQLASIPTNVEVIDGGENVIMPGLVDSHVHVNEPGRVSWEGYKTATKAAAAGGITTIVDMPLNSIPPTTTVQNLKTKLAAAEGQVHVDVAFWGGVIPGNQAELKGLVKAGVVGFKCFLCPSGVGEFPGVNTVDVVGALEELQDLDTVLAFHAECGLGTAHQGNGDPTEYETYLNTRPPEMEIEAIRIVCQLCAKYRVRCHIVHLSTAEGLPFIQATKAGGNPLTVETCHHYLNFASENIPKGATQYKCCPPIRNLSNQEQLWSAISSGAIDLVVSDHSPATADLKHLDDGDFLQAWGGIASVQFGLSLFWTQAQKRGLGILDLARLLSQKPASLCGLQNRKGQIKEGMDADLVIWNPNACFKVEDSIIQFKNKITPYLGMQLHGKVIRTVVRGQTVYQDGLPFPPPVGQLLLSA